MQIFQPSNYSLFFFLPAIEFPFFIIFPLCVFIYVSFFSCIPSLSLLFDRPFAIRFSPPSHICVHAAASLLSTASSQRFTLAHPLSAQTNE
jgi:hypothetical protein